jgi:hypothetical protein
VIGWLYYFGVIGIKTAVRYPAVRAIPKGIAVHNNADLQSAILLFTPILCCSIFAISNPYLRICNPQDFAVRDVPKGIADHNNADRVRLGAFVIRQPAVYFAVRDVPKGIADPNNADL